MQFWLSWWCTPRTSRSRSSTRSWSTGRTPTPSTLRCWWSRCWGCNRRSRSSTSAWRRAPNDWCSWDLGCPLPFWTGGRDDLDTLSLNLNFWRGWRSTFLGFVFGGYNCTGRCRWLGGTENWGWSGGRFSEGWGTSKNWSGSKSWWSTCWSTKNRSWNKNQDWVSGIFDFGLKNFIENLKAAQNLNFRQIEGKSALRS